MTIFFTSDTHFGHARIIELCNRPFKDVTHMNEMLIKNWNEVVSPDDTVFHLGDVAMGNFSGSMQLLGRLNGHLILITGNHDRTFLDPEAMAKKPNKTLAYAERFQLEYEKYFENVIGSSFDHKAAELLVPIGSPLRVVRLSHFPYTGDSHDKPRFDEIRPKDDGRVLLHGHTHSPHKLSTSAQGTQQIHVGVDAWNYFPVSEHEITKFIRN